MQSEGSHDIDAFWMWMGFLLDNTYLVSLISITVYHFANTIEIAFVCWCIQWFNRCGTRQCVDRLRATGTCNFHPTFSYIHHSILFYVHTNMQSNALISVWPFDKRESYICANNNRICILSIVPTDGKNWWFLFYRFVIKKIITTLTRLDKYVCIKR